MCFIPCLSESVNLIRSVFCDNLLQFLSDFHKIICCGHLLE